MVMVAPQMTSCPGGCSGIPCRACASPDGPGSSCCLPPSCSALLRPLRCLRTSAPRRRPAPPGASPTVWPAIARSRGACARRSGSAWPAPSPSSIASPWTLPSRFLRRCTAHRYASRCTDRRSSHRCRHQSFWTSVIPDTKLRSRNLRTSTENSHVETGTRDRRGRLRQSCSNLSGLGSGVLRARTGVLRRTLLRLAADNTTNEATARETGRWLFLGRTSDEGRRWMRLR